MKKNINIYINKEKKIVVTTISELNSWGYNKKYTGKSKCLPEDTFNVELGKRISLARAWIKYDEDKLKNIQKEKSLIEDKLQSLKDEENRTMNIIDRTLDIIKKLVDGTKE